MDYKKARKTDKSNSVNDKIFFIAAGVFAAALVFLICSNVSLRSKANKYYNMYNQQLEVNQQLEAMIEGGSSDGTPVESSRGTKEDLPKDIRKKTEGITLRGESPVTCDDLAYLTVPYYNFDGQTSTGHMIVNKKIADEVLDIFAELYVQQYPIQSMELAEDFDSMQNTLLNSTELASMGNNNTCALYYKKSGNDFSPHSYGLAIDVNPKINPSADTNGSAIPKNAGKYLSGEELTSTEQWARITEDSDICKVFTSRGWSWGGDNSGEPCCFYKITE